jgi:hypothetical protein
MHPLIPRNSTGEVSCTPLHGTSPGLTRFQLPYLSWAPAAQSWKKVFDTILDDCPRVTWLFGRK